MMERDFGGALFVQIVMREGGLMSQYVVMYVPKGDVPTDDEQKIQGRAGVTVLDRRRAGLFLVEFGGPADELLVGVDSVTRWLASEMSSQMASIRPAASSLPGKTHP
jgi:hypothetical protein